MSEAFLHYIWRHQYFDKTELTSIDSQKVNIIQPGIYNTDAGPDFKEAAVFIDEIEWRGHVEIHLKSSDWNAHKHQFDKAYNNTVLHVVWEDDGQITREDGSKIPTLEIGDRVDERLRDRYSRLINNPGDKIPCQTQLTSIDSLAKISMLDKALMVRLERKSAAVRAIYLNNQHNWEETAYQLLAMNFGFKINADPFFVLAKSLPFKILKKHGNSQFQIEALLFGQAGFLDQQLDDEYYNQLHKEYQFLKSKYQLESKLWEHQWRLLRLRPANFPTLRVAQFAAFIYQAQSIFSIFIESEPKQIIEKLRTEVSDYWQKHYQFGKEITKLLQGIGLNSAENICINTVAPLLVAYGKTQDDTSYIEKSEALLQNLRAEKNKIIDKMKEVGFEVKSAFDSQAVIELHNNYCIKSRCLQCTIGAKLVRP